VIKIEKENFIIFPILKQSNLIKNENWQKCGVFCECNIVNTEKQEFKKDVENKKGQIRLRKHISRQI
jgi:hypothetical protein